MKDFEEMKVVLGNKTDLVKVLGHKCEPCFPVITVRLVEHDYGNDPGFPGLHESENFE